MSFSFCRIHGSPFPWIDLRLDLAARLRPLGEDVLPHPPEHREHQPSLPVPDVDGDLTDSSSGHQHLVGRRQVHGDLGAAVAGAHQQDRARRELTRVAVVRRVQLHDVLGQIVGEVGRARHPVHAGREDHVVGVEGLRARGDPESRTLTEQPVDLDAEPHRQLERRDVPLEVVEHLVLAGEAVTPAQGQARQVAADRRGEQLQGVPAGQPRSADAVRGVHDDERLPPLGEVVAGRESGLAGSDDDGVELLRHDCLLWLLRSTAMRRR